LKIRRSNKLVRTVALLPMKAHSERIPNKNIRQFNGKPLYHWILSTLLRCPSIDLVYIDTDSKFIMKDAKDNFGNVQVAERPKKLRGDFVSMNNILMHDVKKVAADIYLQTHATNPLLRIKTIEKAIDTFRGAANEYDSLFSVTPLRIRLWDENVKPINHKREELRRTQDLNPVFAEDSCIYIFTKKSLLENKNRIGENPIMFEIPREEAWDVDEMIDFEIAEFLHKRQLNKRVRI